MYKSAKQLGREYGLSAQEMNLALVSLGYLEGEPGNYTLTDKAMPFAKEEDHHRGCGGYSCYNRYWTIRTFDDSIKDVLDISDELKENVRSQVVTRRAQLNAKKRASMAEIATENQRDPNAEKVSKLATEKMAKCIAPRTGTLKNMGIAGLVILGIGGCCYGVYKLKPRIQKELNKDNNPEDSDID